MERREKGKSNMETFHTMGKGERLRGETGKRGEKGKWGEKRKQERTKEEERKITMTKEKE